MISCKISETVQDRTKVTIYYGLIGSRIRAFDWHQHQWPWMTLNGWNVTVAKINRYLWDHHKFYIWPWSELAACGWLVVTVNGTYGRDNIDHRGFYWSYAVILGYRRVSRHGRENQRRPTVCNFSIWTSVRESVFYVFSDIKKGLFTFFKWRIKKS